MAQSNRTAAENRELLMLLEEKERRSAERKLYSYFPDSGPLRRELYQKHLAFFEAGATYRERLFLAANRVGKTESAGGYEMALHLTGLYPPWWNGRRFKKPIKGRASGDTAKTVRDILQEKMMGPITALGTGLIPKDAIVKATPKQGVSNAFDMVFVKHVSGGVSRLQFKSYDQGRESFQGEEIDVDWLDEESPIDIYVECLLRTMTNNGMVMSTFTPLQGLTEMVMMFLPSGQIVESAAEKASKFVVTATWDDVPHLSDAVKAELWAAIPPFQRDARSKGVPQLGAGAIYPVPESDFAVSDFEIPAHWPRAYGMDVGWNRTAVAWGALDRDTDTLYLYAEHYRGEAEPSVHTAAIGAKSPGWKIPGVIDPASRGRAQRDGLQLLQQYIDLGLDLEVAFNGVESGLYEVWQRLSTGRLKVFKSMSNWLFEFRLYRRDEKGRIVKQNDHLMDCLAPETVVVTEKGPRKLIDLVGTTGRVLSIDGKFVDYVECGRTRVNSPMVEIEFEDGAKIRCTPDHLIMSESGWVPAIEMLGKSAYKVPWKFDEFQTPRKSIKANGITAAETTSSETASVCTEKSGKMLTGRFQKVSTFTTSTMIGRIMSFLTSRFSGTANTSRTISSGTTNRSAEMQSTHRRNGTQATLVASGTRSTTRPTAGSFTPLKALFATVARSLSRRSRLAPIDSVRQPARPLGEEMLDSITSYDLVPNAGHLSQPIDMSKSSPAREFVRVKSLSESAPSDTYCLRVPETEAFAVETGIIVHNCTRYLVMSGIERAKTKPVKSEQRDEFGRKVVGGGSGPGWMG